MLCFGLRSLQYKPWLSSCGVTNGVIDKGTELVCTRLSISTFVAALSLGSQPIKIGIGNDMIRKRNLSELIRPK